MILSEVVVSICVTYLITCDHTGNDKFQRSTDIYNQVNVHKATEATAANITFYSKVFVGSKNMTFASKSDA